MYTIYTVYFYCHLFSSPTISVHLLQKSLMLMSTHFVSYSLNGNRPIYMTVVSEISF